MPLYSRKLPPAPLMLGRSGTYPDPEEDEALLVETRLGLDSLASGEALEGAARFAGGAGRGGSTVADTGA